MLNLKPIQLIKKYIFHNSNARYLENQTKDIEKYGAKSVPRHKTVSEKQINEFTPFRRKSKKPTTLSDSQWFITNFEQQKGEEYLPKEWKNFSQQQKADYIVTDRYSSLVANKIMNKIKDEPVEHSYRLYQGEITGYAVGNEHSVKGEYTVSDTNVHNHPIGAKIKNIKTRHIRKFIENISPDLYKSKCSFSGQDILGATMIRNKSFVIDSNGHKYLFEPKINPKSSEEQVESAYMLKKIFDEEDKNISEKHAKIFGKMIAKMMKKSGRVSKKAVDECVDFYDNYGNLLAIPLIGVYRDTLFKSKEFAAGLLDKVGKYKEL